jgi:myo-inositol-1(or 4)-monophosphatase
VQSHETTAVEAALAAGAVLRAHHGRAADVRHKGAVDLVTAADREAEAAVIDRLRRANPTHRIVAEESGEHAGDAEFVWYVDPLDGTTNFVHAFPHFAVSIALMARGELVVGVVHDPLRGETFRARRGAGAFLGDRPIRVSTTAVLEQALVATGFPYDREAFVRRDLPAFARALRHVQGVRRAGAASLDLAYVACGRLDAYWESTLKPWDTAAGSLLVSEAGGLVTTYDGRRPALAYDDIVASNGAVHEALRAIVGRRESP